MKIEGVHSGPLSAFRRRTPDRAASAAPDRPAQPHDSVSIMGLGEDDLTVPVRRVLAALSEEMHSLREEVALLQERLAEAEALADTDVLTPTLNRRAFVRELGRAVALAQRHETPSSVVYFDLDDFKSINDRFGHAAGDTALRVTAERLWRNVREEDVVARLGGDEFSVLLMHADRLSARIKAEALKRAIEDEPVVHEDVAFDLQVTYGVRQLGGTDDPEQALGEADAAMYLRKPSRQETQR